MGTDIKTFLLHLVHDTGRSPEPTTIDIPYEQWKQEFQSWVERGRRENLTWMTVEKISTTDADSNERGVLSIWELLVSSLGVKVKQVHDARVPAAMQRHAATHLLTFNTSDFARYSFLTAASPIDVVSRAVVV